LSNNIDINKINLPSFFTALHDALRNVPGLDVSTCHSGLIHEDYSYIGLGDERLTKVYLELEWLDKPERLALKPEAAAILMGVLEGVLGPQIIKQNLNFNPRVRIGELGKLNQDYYILSSEH
jgi:hypothetical protein